MSLWKRLISYFKQNNFISLTYYLVHYDLVSYTRRKQKTLTWTKQMSQLKDICSEIMAIPGRQ